MRELTERDLERMAEVAAQTVRKRLGSYPNGHILMQDLEDIVQDALIAAWRAITDHAEGVDNIDAYTRRAAITACDGYFRTKMPARASLASSVRYFLEHVKGFAYGEDKNGLPVAGFSAWAKRDLRQTDRAKRLEQAPEQLSREALANCEGRRIPDLLEALFNWAGCPLAFDAVVATLGEATGRKDAPIEIMDQPAESEPAAQAADPIDQMIHRGCLEQLWQQVHALKPAQRQALLLNFRDTRGRGILELLVAQELCTIEAIAEATCMEREELGKLWDDLPIEDKRIAEMMSCKTQRVVNLRSVAHRAIQKRLGESFLRNCFA